jgi:hypothetical protein
VRPLGTQALGDASTNSLMCSGDDGHQAGETLCCHVYLLFLWFFSSCDLEFVFLN